MHFNLKTCNSFITISLKLIPYFCDLRWIGYRTVSEKQANIFNVNNPVFLVHDEAFVWTVVCNIIGHILLTGKNGSFSPTILK